MSASVFQPIPHSEVARIRSPTSDRKFQCKSIAKVRRVLFEPVDHAETQRFLEMELAKQSISESHKWEFDFVREVPISPHATRGRFVWSLVTNRTIDYLRPIKRPPPVENDISMLYCEPLNEVLRPRPLRPEAKALPNDSFTDESKKQQLLITDFMPARKRNASSAFMKKTDAPAPPSTARPSKMARTHSS